MKRVALTLAAVTALTTAGCGSGSADPAEDGRLDVVASFYPLQWATQQVGGADVRVGSLTKPGAEETYPWGEEELVAKVGGKGFAFIGPGSVSVKCGRNAAEAAEWRDRYPDAVTRSHYVGRYGWNSVSLTGAVPADELRELVDASYDAAVAALPKSRRPTG